VDDLGAATLAPHMAWSSPKVVGIGSGAQLMEKDWLIGQSSADWFCYAIGKISWIKAWQQINFGLVCTGSSSTKSNHVR